MTSWDDVARVRHDFADLIDSLDDAQLDAATYCDGWSPRHLTAHLVAFIDLPRRSFVTGAFKHRFDFDAAFDAMATQLATRPIDDLVATLRAKATRPPLGNPLNPPAMTFTDVVVHQQDIRRPLGIAGGPTIGDYEIALDFVTGHRMAKMLIDTSIFDGVRLSATDSEWVFGNGAEVTGTAQDLLLALLGRPVGAALTGAGAGRFA